MSGGHFDYNCFRISQFAEDLQHEIDINDCKEEDNYGMRVGYLFEPETMEMVQRVREVIKLAGDLAKETEWLYSGDHGEHTYCDLVQKLLKEHENVSKR